MENENREYILRVYGALQEKGYNAVGQIVGYLLTEDPTYPKKCRYCVSKDLPDP